MIYFDNAATTRFKPRCVIDGMLKVLECSSNPGRSSHDDAIALGEAIYETRSTIKHALHANDNYQVIFTKNTTEALNIAILGYLKSFRTKVHVITSMLEHNSTLRPLKYLANLGLIDVTILPIKDNTISISDIELSIHNNTKLIVLNHTSNVIGTSIDVKSVSDISTAYGIPLLLDTAQSLGHIDLSLEDTPITMLAAAGHKGLHGPMGVGFLLVDSSKVNITPLTFGGTGTSSNILSPMVDIPESFEVGTLNAPNIIGLKKALEWTYSNFDDINKTINKYSNIIYNYLKSNKNIELYSPINSNVISFNIKGYTSTEIADFLNNQNIAVRGGLHCAPLVHTFLGTLERGMVRVSPGYNNTLSDIDALIRAIDSVPTL